METNNERLDRIEFNGEGLEDDDFDWLIGQARQAQHLEEWRVKVLKINQHEMNYRGEVETRNIELEEENKELKEKVKYYENLITS